MTVQTSPSRPRPLLRAGLAALALLVATPSFADGVTVGALEIDQPWSRAVPPGARVAGGYATIVNGGAEADRLVGVASPIAGKAEIHEMSVGADGMMTMRPVAGGLEVPAGGTVTLSPGGYHIMFTDLATPPAAGTPFRGTLTFEHAGPVEVEFSVAPIGAPSPPGAHGAAGHGTMDHGTDHGAMDHGAMGHQ